MEYVLKIVEILLNVMKSINLNRMLAYVWYRYNLIHRVFCDIKEEYNMTFSLPTFQVSTYNILHFMIEIELNFKK